MKELIPKLVKLRALLYLNQLRFMSKHMEILQLFVLFSFIVKVEKFDIGTNIRHTGANTSD